MTAATTIAASTSSARLANPGRSRAAITAIATYVIA